MKILDKAVPLGYHPTQGRSAPVHGLYTTQSEGYTLGRGLQSHDFMSNTEYWDESYKLTWQNGSLYKGIPLFDLHLNSSPAVYNQSITLLNSTTDIPMQSLVSLNYSTPVMIVVAVLLLTLAVLTAFGNFLVGLALFKFKPLRTVSNYLIGNLALSDFLLATTILPLSGINQAMGHWVFGRFMCYCWLCVDVLCCTASIWNLCIIAFDRFTATLYPVWYREKRNIKQAAIYIILVWTIAIGICIPPLLGWNDLGASYNLNNSTQYYECMLFDNRSYVIYSASGSFYIPFFITTFLYIRIFMVLRQRMKRMRTPRRPVYNATTSMTTAAKTEPVLITDSPATKSSPAVLGNTLQVHTVEIELTTTGVTENQGSGNTDSSKSLFGSESTHSEDESHEHAKDGGESTTMYMSSDTEAKQSLMQNGIHRKAHSSSKKKQNDNKQTLVIFNPNHALQPLSEECKPLSDTNVKIIVTADSQNGNTETAPSATAEDRKKTNGHHISLHLRNLIKSPRVKRKSCRTQRRQDREVKATIRMAIIIAFFCMFWIGFFTTYLLRGIVGNSFHIPQELDAFFFWLGYSNSAINPILYTIFNEDFRKAFQKMLGCYMRRGGAYSRTRNR